MKTSKQPFKRMLVSMKYQATYWSEIRPPGQKRINRGSVWPEPV